MKIEMLTHRQFLLAGNATVTVESIKTGTRLTFKVQQHDDSPHFVSVLTGSDNENSYTFLGTIFNGEKFVHGRKSSISPNATSAQAFTWMWKHIDALPENQLRFLPACNCCRCGRKLTVPSSIEQAIGPECAKKL